MSLKTLSEKMEFSVIICTLDRSTFLNSCVKSILSQKANFSYEIIIIDQSNLSESADFNSERVKYFKSDRKGLSLNRNIGLRKALGDIICIMDDDATVSPTYFLDIKNIIKRFPKIDIGCGVIYNNENKEPFSRHMVNKKQEPLTLKNIDRCLSSAMFFKSKVFKKIGGFDEQFGVGAKFGGSEESDFLIRSLLSGFNAHSFNKPEVYHPMFDVKKLSLLTLFRKGFNYGRGRGALLKKNILIIPFWSIFLFVKNITVSFMGILLSLIFLDLKKVLWYFSNLIGRVVGFIQFRN